MKIFKNKRSPVLLFLIILAGGTLLYSVLYQEAGTRRKSIAKEDAVKEAMKVILKDLEYDETRNQYIGVIKWANGPFTVSGATETIVSFYDGNQSHEEGPYEIWLLRYTDNWKVISKLVDADMGTYQIIDIDKDDVFEILLHSETGSQGCFSKQYKLIKYHHNGNISVLFSAEGFNYKEAMLEGNAYTDHQFKFMDMDNDNIKELKDTLIKEAYQIDEDNKYSKISSSKTVIVFNINSKTGVYEKN